MRINNVSQLLIFTRTTIVTFRIALEIFKVKFKYAFLSMRYLLP